MADGSIIPRLSLAFSILALAGAGVAVVASMRAQRPPAAPVAVGGDTEELEQRVTSLERQLELVRVGAAVRSAAQVRGAPAGAHPAGGAPAAEVADLNQRLVALERLAAEVTQRRQQGGGALSPEAMAAAVRKVLDRQSSVDERAAALTLLRPAYGRSEGRTHEVVMAALELLERTDVPPKTRAGMIRDLDEMKDPALKDPLVGILTRDPDGRTRREAVETLAVFYDDPQVRGLVERLRDSDPEPEVRAQAMKQLGRWQSRGGR